MSPMSEGTAVQERGEVAEEAPQAPTCQHHWMIASPNGSAMSQGICNRCGAEREFPTALSDSVWDSEVFGSGRNNGNGNGERRGLRGFRRNQQN